MRILLLGPPASGKGTQADFLEKIGFHKISTGELIRKEIAKKTPLGNMFEEIIKKGELVPDKFIIEIIKMNIGRKRNIVFDGVPRNVSQLNEFKRNFKIDKVILLQIPDKEILNRITKRRTCSKCGEVYHLTTKPPKKDNICDKCKSKLYIREDDTVDIVKKRIKVYHKKIKPVIDHYKKSRLLYVVDGTKKPEVVFEKIKKIIGY